MADIVSIPGIKSIAWIRSALLPRAVAFSAFNGLPVRIFARPVDIPFLGFPECSLVSQNFGGGLFDSVTLKFVSLHFLPLHDDISLIVQDILGNHYLIGGREPPFPKFKISRFLGSPDSQSAAVEYEVSFTALKSLVLCMVG